MKTQRRGILVIDKNQAFQAAYKGRERKLLRGNFPAAHNPNFSAFGNAEQPLSRVFTDVSHRQERHIFVLGGGHNGSSQRMLGILLQAPGELHDFSAIETCFANYLRERGLPVRQRSPLIEN